MATDRDPTLIKRSIDSELWREYEWDEIRMDTEGNMCRTGARVTYRIEAPKLLFIRPGGSTHRIVDDKNVAHCVPAVGLLGCVIRWFNGDVEVPVNF
jgi:hypothetical protein